MGFMFIEEGISQSALSFCPQWEHTARKSPSASQEENSEHNATILAPDFGHTASRTVGKKNFCSLSHPVFVILL